MNNLQLNEEDNDLIIKSLEKLPLANSTGDILGFMFEAMASDKMSEDEKRKREEKRERDRFAKEVEEGLLKQRISEVVTKMNVMKMNMENS